MKYLSKFAFFVFVYVMCGNASTLSAEPSKQYEKHYVNHKSVKMTKKGIFVIHKGKEIPVKKLFTDSSGRIYFKKSYLEKGYTMTVPCKNGCGWFAGRCCPKCRWPCK